MATTPTFAQQMLPILEAAILKLAKGTNQTVDFNGQTYTKKDGAKLLEMRSQMRVEAATDAAAGTPGTGQYNQGRRVVTRFIDPSIGPGSPYPLTRPL